MALENENLRFFNLLIQLAFYFVDDVRYNRSSKTPLRDSYVIVENPGVVIDLFCFYVLFSHFRPRDATRGRSFFQMSSYARANVCITIEKKKGKFP